MVVADDKTGLASEITPIVFGGQLESTI